MIIMPITIKTAGTSNKTTHNNFPLMPNYYAKHTKHTYIHIHFYFKDHFPDKPTLAGPPLLVSSSIFNQSINIRLIKAWQNAGLYN